MTDARAATVVGDRGRGDRRATLELPPSRSRNRQIMRACVRTHCRRRRRCIPRRGRRRYCIPHEILQLYDPARRRAKETIDIVYTTRARAYTRALIRALRRVRVVAAVSIAGAEWAAMTSAPGFFRTASRPRASVKAAVAGSSLPWIATTSPRVRGRQRNNNRHARYFPNFHIRFIRTTLFRDRTRTRNRATRRAKNSMRTWNSTPEWCR